MKLARSILNGFGGAILGALVTYFGLQSFTGPLEKKLSEQDQTIQVIIDLLEAQATEESDIIIRGGILGTGQTRYLISVSGIPVGSVTTDDKGYFSIRLPSKWVGDEATIVAARLPDGPSKSQRVVLQKETRVEFQF